MGCPVCIETEQSVTSAIDRAQYDVVVMHLGSEKSRVTEAGRSGVKSVPALVPERKPYHIRSTPLGSEIVDAKFFFRKKILAGMSRIMEMCDALADSAAINLMFDGGIMPREYYEDDFEPSYQNRRRSAGGRSDFDDDFSEGRSRGGERSSRMQERDEYGRFVGREGGGRYSDSSDEWRGSRGNGGGGYVDSAGRHYSRESWERAQEGRARGGEHSHGGRSVSRGARNDDYEDRDFRSGRGGSSRYRDEDQGYITDSAGRHYTRDSWERAQEGRSRGGHH